jgi:membrane protease YdiL (CAAX protease family)
MKNFLPKYHRRVLIIYAIITPIILAIYPYSIKYDFNLNAGVALLAFVFLALYYISNIFFKWRTFKKVALTWQERLLSVLYSFAFAIPEEIIFRGVIQSLLQMKLGAMPALFLSALIFGFAHLPNGNKGTKIYMWNWSFAALAFYGGLLFGLVFIITESLFIPIILHAGVLIIIKLWARREVV